jgi:nucleoside-diphosphate-sugar epimerase
MKKIQCGVIGASGYLGQQLAHYVKANKLEIDIIPYDRLHRRFISEGRDAQTNFDVLLNLGTPNEVFARQGGQIAINAIKEWSEHLDIAIQQAKPIDVVHLSTFHIFGNLESTMNDDSPTIGGNSYGDLHLTCLEIVKELASNYATSLSNIIPSNIYGTVSPSLIPRTDLILNLALERLRNHQFLQLKSDGTGLRDFLWIEDALQAFCAVISRKTTKDYDTVVVASEITMSVQKALEALFSVLGKGTFASWCEFGPLSEKVIPFTFSCNNLKTIMGEWKPQNVLSAAGNQKTIFNINEKLIS